MMVCVSTSYVKKFVLKSESEHNPCPFRVLTLCNKTCNYKRETNQFTRKISQKKFTRKIIRHVDGATGINKIDLCLKMHNMNT